MHRKSKISLAAKFSVWFTILFVATIAMITYVVRENIISRFTREYELQMQTTLQALQRDVAFQHTLIKKNLQQIAKQIMDDNNFRLYTLVLKDVVNPFVIDYAGVFMPSAGLDALEIANHNGIVISSGHARNTFGKNIESQLYLLQKNEAELSLSWFKKNGRPFLCLTAFEMFSLGDSLFYIVGGQEITSEFLYNLQPDNNDILMLNLPDNNLSSKPGKMLPGIQASRDSTQSDSASLAFSEHYSVGQFAVPLITDQEITEANVVLLSPKTALLQLLDDLNRRVLTISGIALLAGILLSIWLVLAVTKPLRQLTTAASNLSFDDLQTTFMFKENDEVGVLSDVLGSMITRLRLSRMRLAKAERGAAMAEITRQINHDIKNGFIPIRNVMQHWQEVAEQNGESLNKVFKERKSTVIESLDYLENLARHYSQLQPPQKAIPVNVNNAIRNLVETYESLPENNVAFSLQFDSSKPSVRVDLIQLRRAFENVLQNAIDAMPDGGTLLVTTAVEEEKVIIKWKDNGAGIPESIRKQLFQAHVTTKEKGTGLGLASVKRIMSDFNGSVTITSEPGNGTEVKMIIPKSKQKALV